MKYDYSSIHVDVPNPEEIVLWGQANVVDDDIFVRQKPPTFGREDEIHITILYGIHSEIAEPLTGITSNINPIQVKLGKIKVFDKQPRFDVVVIDVISDDLKNANKTLHENIEYTDKYGAYRPHVTIAYVKKGKGYRHQGLSMWEGKNFTCDYVVFSSKNGSRQKIPLKNRIP